MRTDSSPPAADPVALFVRLTAPYHQKLLRIAVTLCHDNDMAADLTQEALVRAFRCFDRYDPDRPVLPWLARILRNLHLDSFKTGRCKHEVAEHQLGTRDEGLLARAPAGGDDPLAALERNELACRLQAALSQLDADQQLVVTLCDIEGFSYEEAAEVVQVPIGTVRSRLSRARARLRQLLYEPSSGSFERVASTDPADSAELAGASGRMGKRRHT